MSHHWSPDAVDHVINEHLDDSLSGLCIEIDNNANFNMNTLLALPIFETADTTKSTLFQEQLQQTYPYPEQGINIVLSAPTSPAMKVEEDTLTYLNQGQPYELKFQYIGNTPHHQHHPPDDHKNFKFFKSYVRVTFHDRRLQYCEDKQITLWQIEHPTERILEVDTPLSRGIIEAKNLPYNLNMIEICWDLFKTASVYIKINCISTEFTPKKHGGEKGVPFRLQVDTYALCDGNFNRIYTAYCQVKIFKPKGADRKHKTDREKFEKQGLAEKHKYQPSCPFTLLMPTIPDSEIFVGTSGAEHDVIATTSTPEPLHLNNNNSTTNFDEAARYIAVAPSSLNTGGSNASILSGRISQPSSSRMAGDHHSNGANGDNKNPSHLLGKPRGSIATSSNSLSILGGKGSNSSTHSTAPLKKEYKKSNAVRAEESYTKPMPAEKRRDIFDDQSHTEDDEDFMQRAKANLKIINKKRTIVGGGEIASAAYAYKQQQHSSKGPNGINAGTKIGSTHPQQLLNTVKENVPLLTYEHQPFAPPYDQSSNNESCVKHCDSLNPYHTISAISDQRYESRHAAPSQASFYNANTVNQCNDLTTTSFRARDLILPNHTMSDTQDLITTMVCSSTTTKEIHSGENGIGPTCVNQLIPSTGLEDFDLYHDGGGGDSGSVLSPSDNAIISDTAQWLASNNFGSYIVNCFRGFSPLDMGRLSRQDLIEICGIADGIRLNNALQCIPPRPKLTMYLTYKSAPSISLSEIGNEEPVFTGIYLYELSLHELLSKLQENSGIFGSPSNSFDILSVKAVYLVKRIPITPNNANYELTDEYCSKFSLPLTNGHANDAPLLNGSLSNGETSIQVINDITKPFKGLLGADATKVLARRPREWITIHVNDNLIQNLTDQSKYVFTIYENGHNLASNNSENYESEGLTSTTIKFYDYN